MNPLETLISIIAPHRCLECSREGSLLCDECREASLIQPPARCYSCHKASAQSQVCANCRRNNSLKHVWVASEYEDVAKQLVYKLKFKRANAVAGALAQAIDDRLPDLPKTIIVTHVPTANNRVRMRGYDQSKLIAREVARLRGWSYQELLLRSNSTRQVGSSRKVRLNQLKDSFSVKNITLIKNQHILIVDDVVTTGATLEFAAKALKSTGARTIDAAVFAQPVE